MRKKNFLIIFFFLFLLAGLIYRTYQFRHQPFYDWDEGIYAEVAKEIIKNKSLKTTFNEHPWLNKPPLSHFIIAFVFILTDYSHFFSRLIFTSFSFFTLLLTYLLAKKLFKNSFLALLSPLFLLSSQIYLERSVLLNTDIIIALSWLGYFYYFSSFWKRTFFLILGVWSKSLAGFYPLFLDFFHFFSQKRDHSLKKIVHFIIQILTQIFFASLWYFYAYLNFDQYFIKAHFYDQIFKRVERPIELHFGKNLGIKYYPLTLWQDSKILTLFLLFGVIFLLLTLIRKKKLTTDKIALLFPLPFFFLLLLVKSKIYWYLVFVLPFFTLIAFYPITVFFKNRPFTRKISFTLIFLLFILFVKNTFFYHHKIEISEGYQIAQCLKKLPYENTAFLVDEKERTTYQFIKENNLYTETSFLYGGQPSLVFYANKKINFFYQKNQFLKKYSSYPIIVFKEEDRVNLGINIDAFEYFCSTENQLENERWYVFVKPSINNKD